MSKLQYDDVKELIDNFQNLYKTMHYTLNKKTGKFDVSISQMRLLMIVQKNHNINQNALAEKLNVTKATLSVRLQRLEKSGYIIKKQDPNDKRNSILELSDLGEAFVETGIEIMKEKTMHLFDGVSKEQIEQINGVINIMRKNVDKCKGD